VGRARPWAGFARSATVSRDGIRTKAFRPLVVVALVSDMFGPPRDYEAEESRRSALWGLAALGIIAVLVVVVMLVFSSGGGHHHNNAQNPPVSTAPSESASVTPPASAPSTPSTTPASSTAPRTMPAPVRTGNPCPSPAPCAVQGDDAQLVAAVTAFRAARQLPAVPGSVSPQAQQCALAQGSGPACAPSYSWEPVPAQSAARVIALIVGRDGGKWLLDPSMVSFSVGWAYAPAVGSAPGQWESAILKIRGEQQGQQD
jgi:hypothetical protein